MSLAFDKYHGIGNDFLVVELERPEDLGVERAVKLCDRHFGVGADGVLVVSPSNEGARARMAVINADGSTPEMCGNGLRCVVLHLARRSELSQGELLVQTGAGPLHCAIERDGERALVTTEIGVGTLLGEVVHPIDGQDCTFARISTGNPHAVCFRDPISDTLLDQVGPELSARIEGGVNVEIATQSNATTLQVHVWERGVGRTLACGTGAAATVIAAVQQGRCPRGEPVTVHLPGGPLEITVDARDSATLRGPAEWVYSGFTRL